MTQSATLRSVDRLWPGETVVCIATGPSLTAEDVEYCRGKARVIAINNAFTLAPFADVLYSSDRQWWPHHKGAQTFTGLKYGVGSHALFENAFSKYPDIRVLKNTGYHGLELSPNGLRVADNSGYAAINLAVHFGVARILLLGYDMGRRHGKVHFFGNHVGMSNPTDATMAGWRGKFESLIEPLKKVGVEVINCTPGSSLNCFPMGNLRDVLTSSEAAA